MIQMNTLRFVLLCYGRSLCGFHKNVFISGEDERFLAAYLHQLNSIYCTLID
jgi:hypothetical protein